MTISNSARTASLTEEGAASAQLADVERTAGAKLARMRRVERVTTLVYPVLTTIVLILVWQAIIEVFNIASYLLPTPMDVARAFGTDWHTITSNAWPTIEETLIGFGLSIAVGIPLGVGLALSRTFSRCFYPLLVGSNALPKVAIAPLFVVWFGFGILPKVLIAFLIAFFPIVINSLTGILSIEPEKLHLARSIGLSRLDTFRKIRLPSAAPVILASVKIASSLAVIGAIVGEFVGADKGWGKQLLDANANIQTALLFALFICLTAFAAALFGVVQILERLLIPWHTSVRGHSRADAG